MQQRNTGIGCQLGSWALAAGVGLLVFVLLLVIGDWGLLGAIFMAGVAFLVLGAAFSWLFCRELPEARGPGNIDMSGARDTSVAAPAASAPQAEAPSAAPAPTAADSATGTKAATAPNATTTTTKSTPAKDAAATTTPGSDSLPDVQTANAQADAEAGAQVQPSTRLAGQEELAARKGEWKYDKNDDPKPGKAAVPGPSAAEATPDYDGDGKAEDAEEGTKPATLTAAREGGPDNLKEIKGVGPKLEKLLHSMGFYHFDQIANWSADEVAWVNANLVGFKGRVSRDNWVEQAKILASGEETEFSKRVDKGDVY
ncbi:MAG: endonuclease [Pelagibaca sp.]